VGHWLKYRAEHQWSKENLEFVHKAVGRSVGIITLRLLNESGTEIIPVASEEQADYLRERYEGRNVIWDIGGGLTTLKDELESEAGVPGRDDEFMGPFDLTADIGGGIMLRLCNSIFAAKG